MSALLTCALLFCQSAEADSAPDYVQRYLNRCEAAHLALVKIKLAEIQSLAAKSSAASDPPPELQAAQQRLTRLSKQSAALLPLPMPPAKDDVGIFLPASPNDARQGRSVDVLEVVGARDAIVRAWYLPDAPPSGGNSETTFVDLWVQGVDTHGWSAEAPLKLDQVFHVIGNKAFDTACGQRSVPLLEAIDVDRYRKRRPK